MHEKRRNGSTPEAIDEIIQRSVQEWSSDDPGSEVSDDGVKEYADYQAWSQVLSPALEKVADLPGFAQEQVSFEDPIYCDTETLLILDGSWSGPPGLNDIILSATAGEMEVIRSGPAFESVSTQEAAARLGVPQESFEQVVDIIEMPLIHIGPTYQGIVDGINLRIREEKDVEPSNRSIPAAKQTT